jgi:ferredoxin-NADP reductase
MSDIPKFGVYKGIMTSYEESKMSEGDKVWFTDPDGDLSIN